LPEACWKLLYFLFAPQALTQRATSGASWKVEANRELVLFENFFLCGCSFVASLDRTSPAWCGKSADGARQRQQAYLPRRLNILPRLREPVKTEPPKKIFKGEKSLALSPELTAQGRNRRQLTAVKSPIRKLVVKNAVSDKLMKQV